jgi:hypothetical protein
MEIKMREGNRSERDLQLEMNMAGLGVTGEGPIGKRGAWMASVRKSYLDLIQGVLNLGVAPRYGDLQGKIVYDISKTHTLAILGIAGIDSIKWTKDIAHKEEYSQYGKTYSNEHTVGINWRAIWNASGYSDTSFAHTYTRYKSDFRDFLTDDLDYSDDSSEQWYNLRNVNSFRIGKRNEITFGAEAKWIKDKYDYYIGSYYDVLGIQNPRSRIRLQGRSTKLSAYASFSWNPMSFLKVVPGMRMDYNSYTGQTVASPRLSTAFRLTANSSINASIGIFNQDISGNLLFIAKNGKSLNAPMAMHYIAGFNRLLGKNTILTIEAYQKDYRHIPLEPDKPGLALFDRYDVMSFSDIPVLVDVGKARSRGLEFTLQKKLAEKFYGLMSGGVSSARYLGLDGIWRPRLMDNRYLLAIEGGYRPNNKWQASAKWLLAGGTPYTPFDIETSTRLNSGVLDMNEIQKKRNPAYHSLNMRYDRRYNFDKMNLVLFLETWNVYGRNNIGFRQWNKAKHKAEEVNGWGVLPIGGFELEF